MAQIEGEIMALADEDLKRIKATAEALGAIDTLALIARLEQAEADRDILHEAGLSLIKSLTKVIMAYEHRRWPLGEDQKGGAE